MKLSNFNIFVERQNLVICLNTSNNNYLAISLNSYADFKSNITNIAGLEKTNAKLYNSLVRFGFIIPKDKHELNEIRLKNKEACFNKHYDLIIIPTLDCNLKCWYCWENHIPNSKMSNEIQNRIKAHVRKELEFGNIDSLNLEWFGGEPLMFFDEVVYPLGSAIKGIIENNDKIFGSTFITNGTYINKKMIDKLKELNPCFQITLDGYKDKHDKVRVSKKNGNGTYRQIIESLYLITENIEPASITLRINFDNRTLNNFDKLVSDINDLNKQKLVVHLERVWQTCAEEVEANTILHDAIKLLTLNNFNVSYGGFGRKHFTCKTDRYRQAGINYNGKVHKCTGRPFTSENADGDLSPNGEIIWDRNRLENRLGMSTFENEKCLNCKLLPLCTGPCSQKGLENNWQNIDKLCFLNKFEMSIEEFVVSEFNNLYNLQKKEDWGLHVF